LLKQGLRISLRLACVPQVRQLHEPSGKTEVFFVAAAATCARSFREGPTHRGNGSVMVVIATDTLWMHGT
jgi:hypothetical protein